MKIAPRLLPPARLCWGMGLLGRGRRRFTHAAGATRVRSPPQKLALGAPCLVVGWVGCGGDDG